MSANEPPAAPLEWLVRERFAANLDALPHFGAWIRTLGQQCAPNAQWGYLMELGAVEAVSNIMRHSFGSSRHSNYAALSEGRARGEPCIAVTLRCFEARLIIDLFDAGVHTPDYLSAADTRVFEFDPDDPAGLPEGGMGGAIIRTVMDQWEYRRRLGVNRLRLIKRRV